MLGGLKFPCSSCGHVIWMDAVRAGSMVRCPQCSVWVATPASEAAPAEEEDPPAQPRSKGRKRKKQADAPIRTGRRAGLPILALSLLGVGTLSAIGVIAFAVTKARNAEHARLEAEREAALARAKLEDATRQKEEPERKPPPAAPPAPVLKPADPPPAPVVPPGINPLTGLPLPGMRPGVVPANPAAGWKPPELKPQAPPPQTKLEDLPVLFQYPKSAGRPEKEVFSGYYRRLVHGFTLYVSHEAYVQSDKIYLRTTPATPH